MSTTKEVWRLVDGFGARYLVSNLGRVQNRLTCVIMSPARNPRGYLQVHLSHDGTDATRSVHRLVAAAFCVRPEGSNVVNHLNFNQEDNRAVNLEWTTSAGNTRHSMAAGRFVGGKRVLTPSQQLEVAALRSLPPKVRPVARVIANHYGVSRKTIIRARARAAEYVAAIRSKVAA